eukprot:Gb_15520 [translate_table: standard]
MAAQKNHLQTEMATVSQAPENSVQVSIPGDHENMNKRSKFPYGCHPRRTIIPLICKLQCFYPSTHTTSAAMESMAETDNAVAHENRQARRRGGLKTMPCIIANESSEKVASAGLLANMIVYLTTQFNMKNVDAYNVLSIWSGTSNLSPLIGAFISDAFIGRFWTIAIASIATLLGVVLLWLTAQFPQFRPPHCSPEETVQGGCVSASKGQLGLLFSGFALLTVGAAGIRPCSLAFGADQFAYSTSKGRRSIQSFFNWYYLSSSISYMLAITVIVYIQDSVSWRWGLGIPTVMMVFSVISFLLGTPLYIHVEPEGSAFTGFAQVIVASVRKRQLPLPSEPADLYDPPQQGKIDALPKTQQFMFLNKAAIKTAQDFHPDGSVASPWRLCTLQQVEELKSVIRILPIWASGIAIFTAFAQQSSFSVFQARSMDRHLGPNFQIPAGSFSVFGLLTISVWLPIYDRLVVPFVRRVTRHDRGITLLQRIGIGLGISILSMVVAGFVETKRRNAAVRHGLVDKAMSIVPISALWLVPQYCLTGLAEAFNAIGQLEFFYDQCPQSMRSVAVALLSCSIAIGSYLSSLIVSVVHKTTGGNGHDNWLPQNLNRGHLDYFYWFLAVIIFVNLLFFIVCSRRYRYKSTEVLDEKSDEA